MRVGVPRFARNVWRPASASCLLALLLSTAACRTPGITVQIVNQTEGAIRGIEITYPGGTYGIANLARGNSHTKWIKPTGDAALQISYLDAAGQSHKTETIAVKGGYSGGLAIVLLPENRVKVEDHTRPPATSQ